MLIAAQATCLEAQATARNSRLRHLGEPPIQLFEHRAPLRELPELVRASAWRS
jgi:hypothetical protein